MNYMNMNADGIVLVSKLLSPARSQYGLKAVLSCSPIWTLSVSRPTCIALRQRRRASQLPQLPVQHDVVMSTPAACAAARMLSPGRAVVTTSLGNQCRQTSVEDASAVSWCAAVQL